MWNELITNSANFNSPEALEAFQLFSNKEVSFRFMGTSLSFSLSQSLFSSFDIDSGSQFLLKSVAEKIPLKECHSILDIGSGTGVLGICTAKQAAVDCQLLMEDRNALASLFSLVNATRNGLPQTQVAVRNQLAFETPHYPKVDLILSNIPAKAGTPVIQKLLEVAPHYLTDSGRVCIIIVRTLANKALSHIQSLGYKILHQERNSEYQIIHFKALDNEKNLMKDEKTISFPKYCRQTTFFEIKPIHYTLQTVYNLPDFSEANFTFSQYIELISSIFEKYKKSHGANPPPLKCCVINPGQGHYAFFLTTLAAQFKIPLEMDIFSNDRLQLTTTAHNLKTQEVTQEEYQSNPLFVPHPLTNTTPPQEESSKVDYHLIIFNPFDSTLNHEIEFFTAFITKRTQLHGYLIFSATSTDSNNYQKQLKKFSLVRPKKTRGFRALLLKKNK